jgi:hypothetical protein
VLPDLAPTIGELQAAGASSLRAIAASLLALTKSAEAAAVTTVLAGFLSPSHQLTIAGRGIIKCSEFTSAFQCRPGMTGLAGGTTGSRMTQPV